MLISYLRAGRVPFGCIVSLKLNGEVRIGLSLCNPKDRFKKKTAQLLAYSNAKNPSDVCNEHQWHSTDIPSYRVEAVKEGVARMKTRIEKYFGS